MSLLQLHPWDFDQTSEGWRILQGRGHFAEAALAIETYLEYHADGFQWKPPLVSTEQLPLPHVGLLWFHAGQMRAMAGHRTESLKALQTTRDSGWPESAGPGWPEYVKATIAFMGLDLDTLSYYANDTCCANKHLVQSMHKSLSSGVVHYGQAIANAASPIL